MSEVFNPNNQKSIPNRYYECPHCTGKGNCSNCKYAVCQMKVLGNSFLEIVAKCAKCLDSRMCTICLGTGEIWYFSS